MITIKYKKNCNRIKLHYTFGQLDSIEVPLNWKFEIDKQKQIVNFIKLYQSYSYMEYCKTTNNIDLINYAKKEFANIKKTGYDDLFLNSYPQIFSEKH